MRGLFYFSCGLFLSQRRLSYPNWFAGVALGIALAMSVLGLVLNEKGLIGASFAGAISVPFMMYSLFRFMPAIKIHDAVTSLTFPLFLMHPIFLAYFRKWFAEADSVTMFTSANAFIFATTLSCLVAIILRRISPGIACLIFGGR